MGVQWLYLNCFKIFRHRKKEKNPILSMSWYFFCLSIGHMGVIVLFSFSLIHFFKGGLTQKQWKTDCLDLPEKGNMLIEIRMPSVLLIYFNALAADDLDRRIPLRDLWCVSVSQHHWSSLQICMCGHIAAPQLPLPLTLLAHWGGLYDFFPLLAYELQPFIFSLWFL